MELSKNKINSKVNQKCDDNATKEGNNHSCSQQSSSLYTFFCVFKAFPNNSVSLKNHVALTNLRFFTSATDDKISLVKKVTAGVF